MIHRLLPLLALAISMPAAGEVYKSDASGFVVRQAIEVPATPDKVWATFTDPAKWWDGKYSYSQDAANLSMDARAGGCFCEVLPNKDSPNAAPRGSVEHLHVVYAERPRALRLRGALGPLQSGPAQGMLTLYLEPAKGGTKVLIEYVVGGFVREDPRAMATEVDHILGVQVVKLGKALGIDVPTVPPPGVRQAEGRTGPKQPEAPSEFEAEMETFLDETSPDAVSPPPAQPIDDIDYDLRMSSPRSDGEYEGR